MSQDFHGGVGQVAEGDINNYGISISLADKAEARGLLTAQRKELHEIRAKCEELGDDPKSVWRMVHAQLGVNSLSEIQAAQFPAARDTMRARLEQLQEDADKRRLVGKILRVVAEKDAKMELNNFCELKFGRTQLSNLKKAQLQCALEFIQGLDLVELGATPQAAPVTLTVKEFLLLHKQNAAVIFCIGLLIGGIWF